MDFLKKLLPKVTAQAHCDVPCGIYDPTPAKIAVKTVQRMINQINELIPPPPADAKAMDHYFNDLVRRVTTKEEHAQICKKELLILWSDYFKPEHLEKYPDLHDKFWKATKLCSACKQDVDEEKANQLVSAVDQIAEIFYQTKNDPRRFESYKDVTDKLF
ncbi:MAG: superoxide dismutase, Ni [Candidatus Harrisonbacteria bacterium CG10_big_fil_rev_8_21_14_0_10_45_28]|uniref:Superoxide dismutase, Ni n=1 Tax=Candidatus Harrisonbacteria bacterium CG10_big_fil_rev_8_21_14_0_10_45_28 TaxID=1974586 RepID=A0A2H0UMB3_9BACT|nr:MAG: superoxide dismutase, Ni [Candidatus Harrisonbacteria bacterium CG10_big_fil_rev_8_21_14_0_10_45_28]